MKESTYGKMEKVNVGLVSGEESLGSGSVQKSESNSDLTHTCMRRPAEKNGPSVWGIAEKG